MRHKHLFLSLLITILLQSTLTVAPSTQNNNESESQGLFPLRAKEIAGLVLIVIVAGLANTGGIGGGTLLTSILIMFFYYTENQSLAIVYGLVFGGSLGNFINIVGRRDAKTKKPLINYDLALLCMPTMVLGTTVGVILGRMVAPIVIILGIILVTTFTLLKVFKKAKKQYADETREKHSKYVPFVNSDGDFNHERLVTVSDSGDQGEIDPQVADILKRERKLFPKSKYGILIGLLFIVMILSLFRGSNNFDSIIGLSYCGVGYWGIYILTLVFCLVIFFFNLSILKKNMKAKEHFHHEVAQGDFELNDESTKKLTSLSGIAGVLAGLLGIGGGMVMNPTLLSMGIPSQTVAATSGFFVVQTSFISLFQSLLYGDVPLKEEGFFFLVSLIGSFCVSLLLTWLMKKTKRASLVLFALLAVLVLSIVVTPIFEVWENIDNLKKLVEFKSIC